MGKLQLYEAIQDERNKPKPAVKPIEQWDETELRRAMLADAKNVRRVNQSGDNMSNRHKTDEWRLDVTIDAMKYIGRPVTRRELADLLDLTPDTAYNYARLAIMADLAVVEKMPGEKEHYYSLVEGYDGQFSLAL